ncbi:MAG TPA: hypothetical protein VII61_14695 [Ktedonobacteraceae bacterium]|jgi:hypothetical protein
MADDEKPKKTAKLASDATSKEEKSQESSTEGGASESTPEPGTVTLSPERLERLRRKLKAKYH